MLKKISLISCIFMLITVSIFAAPTIGELEDNKDELTEEMKETEQKIEELKLAVESAEKNILQLDDQIEGYQAAIEELQQKLAEKKAEINNTILELEDAMAKEEQYYDSFKERIKVMYEYGNTEYIEVLLEAKGLSDFYNRLEYINELVEYDNNMLKMMEENRNNIIAMKEELDVQKLELEHITEETKLQQNAAENAKVAKAQELKTLNDDKEMYIKQVQETEEAIKVIETTIARKKEENKMKYDGGKMQWPVLGRTYISSYFGWRTHPVYKYKSFHKGIDIPAPTGTKVLAAAKGKVIFAGWSNVYGKYLLVDHGTSNGSSYVTMYAHNSKLLVKEGDTVNKEQVIAKAGSTGWSTGSHLHFGVRIDNDWTDPTKILEK